MRHRGPIESRKLNKNQSEIHANIQLMFARLSAQQEKLQAFRDAIHYGVEESGIAGEDDTFSRLRHLSVQLGTIKGGVRNV